MQTVLVWRDHWLPPSETFILNQIDAMATWSARLGGVQIVDDRLLRGRGVEVLTGDLVPRRVARLGLRVPKASLPLRRMFKDIDLVHAHFGPDATTVLDPATAFGVPRVITFHGYDATTSREHRLDWPMTRRWHELTSGAALVVAVSQFIADRLVHEGVPEDRVRVVHTGIPVPADPVTSPSSRTPGILFVGRLVEKKGLDVLLHAVAMLPPGVRDTPVTVVGDGPLREQLVALARSLRLQVRFLGALSPEGVAEAMRSHPLFVAPSRTAANGDAEGFGMVFLEAAAARMPVLTTRSGGNVDAVDHGVSGLVLEPDDPRELAGAIHDLLRDSRVGDAMGDAGRRRVIERFDVIKQTALLEREYDRVTSSA